MPHPPMPPMPPSPFPPYARWYTDVEPAYERPGECECHYPPVPDVCVCVTQEDAENWNGAYTAVSAISAGLDMQTIASAAQLLTSADYWNQTHDVVSAGSATWNQLPEVSSTLASEAQSALWLINKYLLDKGILRDDTLSGDGVHSPLSVAYSERFDQLYETFDAIYRDIVTSYDAKAIWEAMGACQEKYDKAISALFSGHGQNFQLILELMGVVPNSGNYPMIWAVDEGMDSSRPSTYNDDYHKTMNWMFYNFYKG